MSSSCKKPPKTPSSQPRPQISFEKSVLLTDWWLIEVESNSKERKVGVAGFASIWKQATRHYESAAIIKRHDPVTLETEDGITIVISNSLNMCRTIECGFPSEVCKHFLFGFPYYWKEFADVGRESTHKSGLFRASCVNDVAISPGDLPVAHVRDILMLSSGDSYRCLIEKCISSHIPGKLRDNVFKKDASIAKTKGKHMRQEDDTDDITQLVAKDLSDDATPKAQTAIASMNEDKTIKKSGVLCYLDREKEKYACKDNDTNHVSRFVVGDLSDDATPQAQDVNIIEKKRKGKSGVTCSLNRKKAKNTRKEGDTKDGSQLATGDLSDDATPKAQTATASMNEEKMIEKSGVLCYPDREKEKYARKERDANHVSRLVAGDLSDDATPKAQNASIIEKRRKDKSGVICSPNQKKAKNTRKEDDTKDTSRLVASALSDDATPRTQNASKVKEKSKEKDESTPKAKTMRGTSVEENPSRRTTRSMSRSCNLGAKVM